jgi:hypothetical protein
MVSKNYKTCSTQFLLHLLIALPINFLYHPLPNNQTETVSHLGVVTLMVHTWNKASGSMLNFLVYIALSS